MGKTNYLRNALLNAVLTGVAYASPSALYVGLFSSPPDDTYTVAAPTGTELSGNGYARTQVFFGAAVNNSTSNINSVFFPVATPLGWATATHFGIFDQAGNLLYWSALLVPVTVLAGQVFDMYVGNIQISEV